MNVELIVDSTVDVPEHIRSRLTVVPLTIHFGQEEYLDGVTMDKHRFYERLVESDVLPTTSQASPAAFDREFRRVRCSGGSAVVLIIAAGLSGTYQSACIAAAEYDNIYVVDSGTAAIGAGIDISRDAILQATNQPCQAVWCVGDLRRLPFADGTFSAVLDVLTPANYDEFRRVLSPDGMLVKVYPGQDYLREIRAARGMSAYEEGQVDAYLREKAQLVKAVRVHETLPVSPELWGDFVRMTPLNHDLSAAEKDALAQRADAHVTVDLHVALCKFR